VIVYEITGTEHHSVYETLEVENGNRHYSFLQSVVTASLSIGRPFLSQTVIKAINYHAIACLHTNAGEYRPCPVSVGDYVPPQHYRVQALMDDFVNMVNRIWESWDPVTLATFALWRLNHIHPFINGNGRTARAACYFVLCVRQGGLLKGDVILPELLRRNRDEYVAGLKAVDASLATGNLDLSPLHAVVARLVAEQIGATEPEPPS
jgi:Fic family protein